MEQNPHDIIKILAIDDSRDDQLLYKRTLLKSMDTVYQFTDAYDGEEGLRLAEERQPACVLLDYSLPGRNGIEVLKRIRSKFPFMPVVMLTGQGNEKVAVHAIQSGAQNYIAKSAITSEALEHTIRMAVEHCVLQKRNHEQRASLEIFSRALAHDLREPARTIHAFSELAVESEPVSSRSSQYLQHIKNASSRMLMLIDTVFMYTQLDSKAPMTCEQCDLNHVLNVVKENIHTLIEDRGTVVTSNTLPVVHANRAHMIQLLQNLLCNAINHNGMPVNIHVRAAALSDFWELTVRDNGDGIEGRYIDKIFEPFTRMGKFDTQGAGLGLAICKKIVEAHEGQLWCESQEGSGAQFSFTLPRALPISPVLQSGLKNTLNDPLPHPSVNKRYLANILLVDDNRADIEQIKLRLLDNARLHCNFLVVTNADDALALLYKGTPEGRAIDMVLLDINMPRSDGFDLMEHLQSMPLSKRPMIVMYTGSAYDKDMIRAKELGASGYITKPIDFSMLKSLIEQNKGLRLLPETEGYSLWSVH